MIFFQQRRIIFYPLTVEVMTTLQDRVSKLEGAYEQVDRRLVDLTESVNGLRADVRAVDSKFEAKFEALDAKIDSKINTLIIVMATVGIAVAGAIVTLALSSCYRSAASL